MERCRLCAAPLDLTPLFSRVGFGGHKMNYVRCARCGSLMCIYPHWLEAAYATSDDANDPGAPDRAKAVARLVQALGRPGRWLDYGAGPGTLATLLGAQGLDVDCYDPFRQNMKSVPRGPYLGACLIEVLEHLMDPGKVMRTVGDFLEPDGCLVATTNLYRPEYGPDWPYLASEFGQHVTFPSEHGLAALARRTGFRWKASVQPNEFPALETHLLVKDDNHGPSLDALPESGFSIGHREPMTVVLFNHFHAGDIIMSRSIISDILAANPNTKFELQCRARYTYLWSDLGAPVTSLAEGQERVLRDGGAINLWFATFGDMLSRGLTYANHVETYNRQAKALGLAELRSYDGEQRFVSLPPVEIPQTRTPSVLVENGAVLSGQPVHDINRHLKKLAKDFPHVTFYCAGKIHERQSNIVDVSNWNLCQLSVLSERCSAIISRLSAITVCSFTKANHGRRRLVFGQPLGCPIWDEAGTVYVPNDYLSLRNELHEVLR